MPGDFIRLVVRRDGWVVVNDIQLGLHLPQPALQRQLEFLLCKEAEAERWRLAFYRLKGYETVEREYQERLAELEGRQSATSLERDRLQRERDQARQQADELAKQLAAQPAGSGGGLYDDALRLHLDGKLDEALARLDDAKLQKQVEDAAKGHALRSSRATSCRWRR